MPSFTMPRFYLPWPSRLNPHLDQARANSLDWARKMGIFDSALWTESRFESMELALLCAYGYPDAPGPELDVVTEWNVWVFFFDDYFVEAFKRGRDLAGARAHLARLPAFMPLEPGGDSPEPTNPVERGLADLWPRTVARMSPGWRARFAASTTDQFEEVFAELANIGHDRVPNPIEYIEMRRKVGGAPWSADLLEYALDVELPPEIVGTRPMRVIRDSFADAVLLRNDIFSYEREIHDEGEHDNGILVLERFLGLDTQQAADTLNDLLTSRLRQFEHTALTEVPPLVPEHRLGPAAQSDLARYLTGLQDYQSGAHDWHLHSSRYQTEGADRAPSWGPPGGLTSARPAGAEPPAFPAGIPLRHGTFRNWSGEIESEPLWTATPAHEQDVLTLANWAHTHGWRLRPRGAGHSWAPLVTRAGERGEVLLVDLAGLTAVRIQPGEPASVTAQTGVRMEDLLAQLEIAGYGVTAVPAPGEITLGGVLAVDGHGTAVPADGEIRAPGHSYGTVSNLVLRLTAVVWDAGAGAYVLREFDRDEPEIGALLVSLGRILITEVTLRVGVNQRLRCQSFDHIPVATLLAPPTTAGPDSLAAWVRRHGRVNLLWYPYTDTPWLQVWSVEPQRPPTARVVDQPYNYPFRDVLPRAASELLARILAGNPALTPAFQAMLLASMSTGLSLTASRDLWGWSKNTLLNIRGSALRVTSGSWAVLTSRANLQRAVSEFHRFCRRTLAEHAQAGRYPINGMIVAQISGLDEPREVAGPGAAAPLLSVARPRPDHPDWDVVLYLDLTTTPGTADAPRFYRETEQWLLANFTGDYATVRPEWSKGWAYDGESAYADPGVREQVIPSAYRAGQSWTQSWDGAVAAFEELDPHGVFGSPFLDSLLAPASAYRLPKGASHAFR
ncbi:MULTISPECIES: cholesterol oxidase substrate-binding domain-containing protein [unclassified Crossiella]|uniref:cholesterol oxidase substrate-binding domain-containing protein n=1 Tax=unclassified Crossiella TaxID=2620835 RepID=UPI001FFF2B0E|nr:MULTISPECIES: cholesterol oxidase substrate-binding domain-containing protein [unclassified Crossiella]MCK2244394.1 FAD-binding protein [Crossiella sp. S99.2]MCK2257778.1 FAD-binding protein [Crossiella sp. S99.1]